MTYRNRVKRVQDEHTRYINTPATTGQIVGVSPETESLLVDIGSTQVQVAHPFVSGSAWIRAMPSVGTQIVVSYNTTRKRYEFVSYAPSQEYAAKQLEAYSKRKSLYRDLKEGEIELVSSGSASMHFSSRPIISGQAGCVTWAYDSDRLESSTVAPTHIMRGHNNKKDRIGNEMRFGVVKRPTSYVNETYALTAPLSMPSLGKYTYAYEHLITLDNDNNAPLFDFRTGEVYDNTLTPGIPFAMPALGKNLNLPLRARYRFFCTIEPGGLKALNQSTDIEISHLGDIDIALSKLAIQGFCLNAPLGGIKTNSGLFTTLVSKLAMSFKSELDKIKLDAMRGIDLTSTMGITNKATTSFEVSAGTGVDIKAKANMSLESSLNTDIKAIKISIDGSGMVSIHGATGLSLTGALGKTGRIINTLQQDIVTGIPTFVDATLTA
jgi:hypothetical protein